MPGVTNVDPVANDSPPFETAYQFIVPVLASAPSTTEPVPHLESGVVLVIAGTGFTVTVTGLMSK
jgi:hypothetical protein